MKLAPTARSAAVGAGLAVLFAAAALAGAEIDPDVDESSAAHEEGDAGMTATAMRTTGADHGEGGASAVLPGLAAAQDGYRLVPEATAAPARDDAVYRFRIVDDAGDTVRSFDEEHERRMHLIAVGRDFTAFQHLHPEQHADGSWSARMDLRRPGAYRVFADFATDGRSLTLAADLLVAGDYRPAPLPEPSRRADAGDGYEVELASAEPRSGAAALVEFTVSRDGRELDGVEPYLGADGHLVALREHDQAFLHTHPEGEAGGSGPIAFQIEYPTAGRYRLYLQFKHRGEVRTAAFTQAAGGMMDATEGETDQAGEAGHEEAPDAH